LTEFTSQCVIDGQTCATSNYKEITAMQLELEYGPIPNVMVALPNIGGALCSMPQSLAHAHY